MITVTGKLESSTGAPLGRRCVFRSQSTPQAGASGVVTTNTTRKILSDPSTGLYSIQLRPGNYAVTYETRPDQTNFNISIPSNLDGTTVSIDGLIVSTFATLPLQAPYLVWNGVRAGHIQFDPIQNPTGAGMVLSEVAYTGSHITTETYKYWISYTTAEGETGIIAGLGNEFANWTGTGTANKAVRVPLAVNPARVLTKKIWRNTASGSGIPWLLAEVAASVPYYDDWESHANFLARAVTSIPVQQLNTTAGIIYSQAGWGSLYCSIDGVRFLAHIVGDVTIDVGYKLFYGIGLLSAGSVLTRDAGGFATWAAPGSIIGAGATYFIGTPGQNPNGNITATRPALAYDANGALWMKTNATTDNTGWEQRL